MKVPTKLSGDARSNAQIRACVAELTRRRNQLDFIRAELCKIASWCSSERIHNLKLPDRETYCEDLFVLWVVASDCSKLCDSAISRLDDILKQNI